MMFRWQCTVNKNYSPEKSFIIKIIFLTNNVFNTGFTLTIKLKTDEDGTIPTQRDRSVNAVKTYVESNFVAPKLM